MKLLREADVEVTKSADGATVGGLNTTGTGKGGDGNVAAATAGAPGGGGGGGTNTNNIKSGVAGSNGGVSATTTATGTGAGTPTCVIPPLTKRASASSNSLQVCYEQCAMVTPSLPYPRDTSFSFNHSSTYFPPSIRTFFLPLPPVLQPRSTTTLWPIY